MSKHDIRKLSVIYDKRYKDFVVKYPRSCDGNLALHHIVSDNLHHVMPNKENKKEYPYNFEVFNFVKELEKRGYDLKTLKFSIKLKPVQGDNNE
jgi:hypothetical protein